MYEIQANHTMILEINWAEAEAKAKAGVGLCPTPGVGLETCTIR